MGREEQNFKQKFELILTAIMTVQLRAEETGKDDAMNSSPYTLPLKSPPTQRQVGSYTS
jgi:hypothetical protein